VKGTPSICKDYQSGVHVQREASSKQRCTWAAPFWRSSGYIRRHSRAKSFGKHGDPGGLSAKTTWVNNTPENGEASVSEELDGLGNNVGIHGTFTPPERISNVASPSDRVMFVDTGMGD